MHWYEVGNVANCLTVAIILLTLHLILVRKVEKGQRDKPGAENGKPCVDLFQTDSLFGRFTVLTKKRKLPIDVFPNPRK